MALKAETTTAWTALYTAIGTLDTAGELLVSATSGLVTAQNTYNDRRAARDAAVVAKDVALAAFVAALSAEEGVTDPPAP
jgi:hypothetical protein